MLIIIFSILLSSYVTAYANDCDYKIDIFLNSSEFTASDFAWKMKATKISGDSTNISAAARIEDSAGKAVKTYKPWSNESISKQKTSSTYSPNLKEGQYTIISEIIVECNDVDKSNNLASKNFIIKNSINKSDQSDKNNIPIQKDVPQQEIQNNSSEQQIISNPSENTIMKNNTSETLIPQKTSENNQTEIKSFDNEIRNNEATGNSAKTNLVYESGSEKSKQIVLFALLGFSVLLNIILIWKR